MKKILTYVFILSIFVPTFAFAFFNVSLKNNSSGSAVVELQGFLHNQNFYSGKLDGKFGPATLKAVKAFQLANGLTPDGNFGKMSRAKADTILATQLPISPVINPSAITVSNTATVTTTITPSVVPQPIQGQPLNTQPVPVVSTPNPAPTPSTAPSCSLTSDTPNTSERVNLIWTSQNLTGVKGTLYITSGQDGGSVQYQEYRTNLDNSGTMQAPNGSKNLVYKLTFGNVNCYAVFADPSAPATTTLPDSMHLTL